MSAQPAEPNLFMVRARHEDRHHGRLLSEPSFEAAALAYIEHLPLPADIGPALGVVVHEISTGHERSYVIHLDTGEATAA